ncbi:MAG: alkaline shock response membrane anchor protein AmaP [Eubacteriales bacterium]|nr:alkaline shock response membrane anchor protein AmaP [Bacillota bacterium]
MGPFDRILLAIYSLFLTAVFALFSAIMIGWAAPVVFLRELFYPGRPEVFWPLMAVLILAGVRLFWASLGKKQEKYVALEDNNLGNVRIAIAAIQSLVEKVVTQITGVSDLKSRITQGPQGVNIHLNVVVSSDVGFPQLSGEIQLLVTEQVLAITGITVNSVRVFVENIAAKPVPVAASKQRVR